MAPLYWLFRLLGFQPDTAYQLWMIALAGLNFTAIYLLLRRFLGLGLVASSIASLLFAFNTAQYSKLTQQQLVPQFYVLLALAMILVMFTSSNHRRRCTAVFVFFLAWTVQFYTSFYVFFFGGLTLGLACFWALFKYRRQVFEFFRTHQLCIVVAVALTVLLLLPALNHYFSALGDVGFRKVRGANLARPYSWFMTGELNLLYGWIQTDLLPSVRGPHNWGIGFLTLALAATGLYWQRRRALVQIIVLATFAAALLTTHITVELGLWPYVREIIPGAKALRALGRAGMIQLLPAAIGLGFFFQRLVADRRRLLLLFLATLCVLEQVNLGDGYVSKTALREDVDTIAERVTSDCEAFWLFGDRTSGNPPELASWTTLETGKPTVNGRYGNFPPGYPSVLRRSQRFPGTLDRAQVISGLQEWCQSQDILFDRIQIIEVPAKKNCSDSGAR